jgi:hypothetical protein
MAAGTLAARAESTEPVVLELLLLEDELLLDEEPEPVSRLLEPQALRARPAVAMPTARSAAGR